MLTLGETGKTVHHLTKWEEIRDAINQELDRGVTLVPALGGYANEQRMMVMTVVKQKQFANLQRLITHIDPEAFFVVNDANEVQGAGFTFGKHYRSDRVLTQVQTKETA
ncbi:MAG: YitT family protein [Merdibacter sp.]